MSVAIVSAVVPILRDMVRHFTSGTKKAAQGAYKAASGNAALAVVVMWCYPFITSFIPFLQPYTIKGFEIIAQLPEWYVDYFVGISVAFVGAHEIRRGVARRG